MTRKAIGDPIVDAIVRALADPGFHSPRPARVEHLQTHISHVFLAGPYAYKLKKAVRFPFLDFGTVELRRRFCAEEVRLNRRLCPDVYLDVLAVTRDEAGALHLGGPGTAVDHVVRMRRLPADRMLPTLVERDAVGAEAMAALARRLAAFHATAATGPDVAAHAEPEALRRRWADESAAIARFAGSLLAVEDHEVLADFGPAFVGRHDTLLRARLDAGRIREGHGDLHAGNVCLVDTPVAGADGLPPLPAGIYLFDCMEFSHALRCTDVASEVGFLAMDLEARGRPDLGRAFVEAYVEASDDRALEALLPFYAAYRAIVRGKVAALESEEPEVDPAARERAVERARRHLALAVRWAWRADGPAVIACCGLSGTGKSTLAADIAATTGFEPLATDVLRRRSVPAAGPAPYGEGGYTAAARRAVYDALAKEADALLAAGRGVVADATYLHAADRARLAAVAGSHRRPIVFVECAADPDVVRARLARREHGGSPSDARWETYLAQRSEREPFGADEPHVVVDTGERPAAARATAVRALWRWRRSGRPG
jgi:aminoglycoside phosphotransferase family enzyme/predicted kinase